MFRSSTIIREPALNLAKVIFMLKHSVKLSRYLICGCVAGCLLVRKVMVIHLFGVVHCNYWYCLFKIPFILSYHQSTDLPRDGGTSVPHCFSNIVTRSFLAETLFCTASHMCVLVLNRCDKLKFYPCTNTSAAETCSVWLSQIISAYKTYTLK